MRMRLHLVDVSGDALAIVRINLKSYRNISFHKLSVADIPLPDGSLDFALSLGMLPHVPDTQGAIEAIARRFKSGASFLIHLYNAFDDRPAWYRARWQSSNVVRLIVSRPPHRLRIIISKTIAATVYWPLARLAGLLKRSGLTVEPLPLSWYAGKSFYVAH